MLVLSPRAGRPADRPGAAHQPKTASLHVSQILAKLGVADGGEAAAIAHRLGDHFGGNHRIMALESRQRRRSPTAASGARRYLPTEGWTASRHRRSAARLALMRSSEGMCSSTAVPIAARAQPGSLAHEVAAHGGYGVAQPILIPHHIPNGMRPARKIKTDRADQRFRWSSP